MSIDRTKVPRSGPEYSQLRAWLGWHRDTLRMKCDGLDAAQLAQRLGPSTLTLGGLMKHMALVEDGWFSSIVGGDGYPEFRDVDWDNDPDWDFRTAADDTPEELRALFEDRVAASDRILDEVGDDLDRHAVRPARDGSPVDVRWILVHMIEEYARHNGHADLIRESIDGQTGD